MQIGSDEIDVQLPRALFGGLKQGPTEELLRRVAKDYALLYDENRKLRAKVERLEPLALERSEPTPPPQLQPQPQPPPQFEILPARVEAPPPETSAARETDALARIILESAQRTAREMRESARRDCEAMLKKAGARARELERENEQAKASKRDELEELEALKRETAERMRTSLQTLLKTP